MFVVEQLLIDPEMVRRDMQRRGRRAEVGRRFLRKGNYFAQRQAVLLGKNAFGVLQGPISSDSTAPSAYSFDPPPH
jgi:hypothetical protein